MNFLKKFFKKTRDNTINTKIKTADIYLATSSIVSSYNDNADFIPKCITMYFLVKCKEDSYYELFSGKKLEKKSNSKNGSLFQNFDTPYVTKVEPLCMYLQDQNEKTIDIKHLFDFITYMNILASLRILPDTPK